MRILFVSSEIFPFAKTGGLADVSASLPRALQAIGHQVCVLMPAYRLYRLLFQGTFELVVRRDDGDAAAT